MHFELIKDLLRLSTNTYADVRKKAQSGKAPSRFALSLFLFPPDFLLDKALLAVLFSSLWLGLLLCMSHFTQQAVHATHTHVMRTPHTPWIRVSKRGTCANMERPSHTRTCANMERPSHTRTCANMERASHTPLTTALSSSLRVFPGAKYDTFPPVSYTHLTLPTIA